MIERKSKHLFVEVHGDEIIITLGSNFRAVYHKPEDQPQLVAKGTPVEWTKEKTYFFKLSAYQKKLLAYYDAHPDFILPETRRNEVTSFVRSGLRDLSVSRSTLSWGIPVPDDPKHVIYVWLDALANYITALGYGSPDTKLYDKFWPADLQMIGKEIVRFHCVYWPAFLMAAGLPLPKGIMAHGWLLFEENKMSKSRGNIVRAETILDVLGADALRYFLLREVGFEGDGNFTWERFDERYTAELADGLGNLASRSLAMLLKYRSGVVPTSVQPSTLDQSGRAALATYARVMDALDLRGGAEAAWSLVSAANLFVQQSAPWALAKAGKEAELDETLGARARALVRLALMTSPFIPGKAQSLWEMLGLDGLVAEASWQTAEDPGVAGRKVSRAEVLFPKPASV